MKKDTKHLRSKISVIIIGFLVTLYALLYGMFCFLMYQELEVLGVAKGTVVYSKNIGRDFMAGMKTLVGGELVGYTEMLNDARQIAVKRMVDEGESLGADAIINIRYGSSAVMQGAAEIIAYGTAVKYI